MTNGGLGGLIYYKGVVLKTKLYISIVGGWIMKINMQKPMTIILTLVLTLSLSSFSSAANPNNNETQTQIDLLLESHDPENHIKAIELMELEGKRVIKSEITVYDLLDDMDELQRSKHEQEIIDEVDNLSLMDEDELKTRNFTDTQIKNIKNFDGTREMALEAAPSIYVYGAFNNFNRKSSLTTVQMVSAFRWNGGYSGFGAPWKDIFACVWSSPFNPSSETGHLKYVRTQNNKTVNTTAKVIEDSLRGSHIQVPQSLSNSNGTHWINSGSIITNLRSNSSVGDVSGFTAYGKNTVSLTPGVTFSSKGTTLGISFSTFVKQVGQKRLVK